MGEMIVIAVVGLVCLAVGRVSERRARAKALNKAVSAKISQIPFWDIDK